MPQKKKSGKKPSSKNSRSSTSKTSSQIFRCTCCGREASNPDKIFYKLTYSDVHAGNDQRSHVCIDCIKMMFDKYEREYDDPEFATKVICANLNIPFYHSVYESVSQKNEFFNFGLYIRMINNKQYKDHTFALTLANGELEILKKIATQEKADKGAESTWTPDERRAKKEVLEMLGYDPFEEYYHQDRKILYTELNGYLNDEELLSDNYKLSQVIQLINNNNQINQYDIAISKLDSKYEIDSIKILNTLKKDLVLSNEKIAKENGISVKSRGTKKSGKGTLTGLMRDMRDKNLTQIETNFYDQLRSQNTQWAVDVSMKSMKENCFFDENDINDIIDTQREMVIDLTKKKDDLEEEKRLIAIENLNRQNYINALENELEKFGVNISVIKSRLVEIETEMQNREIKDELSNKILETTENETEQIK